MIFEVYVFAVVNDYDERDGHLFWAGDGYTTHTTALRTLQDQLESARLESVDQLPQTTPIARVKTFRDCLNEGWSHVFTEREVSRWRTSENAIERADQFTLTVDKDGKGSKGIQG